MGWAVTQIYLQPQIDWPLCISIFLRAHSSIHLARGKQATGLLGWFSQQ